MSRIFDIFTGEFVRITFKRNLKQTMEHKGTIKIVEQPKEIEGYLTEECDDSFYLGIEPGHIHIAVNKDDYSTMEVIDPNDLQENLLNELIDGPETENGMN